MTPGSGLGVPCASRCWHHVHSKIPSDVLHLLLALERLSPQVSPALLEGCADLRASQ